MHLGADRLDWEPTKSITEYTEIQKFDIWASARSVWHRVTALFQHAIQWISHFFSNEAKTMTASEIKQIESSSTTEHAVQEICSSFIKKGEPAEHLRRLASIQEDNALSCVCTEAMFQTLPKINPMHLGFEDPMAYRAHRADRLIALGTVFGSLGMLMSARSLIMQCVKEQEDFTRASELCLQKTAGQFQSPEARALLITGLLFYGATLFAHSQGWIGTLMHDRSLEWREKEAKSLFQALGEELFERSQKEPLETSIQAEKILSNIPFIETALQMDLQLRQEKTKEIVDLFTQACEVAIERCKNHQPKPNESVS